MCDAAAGTLVERLIEVERRAADTPFLRLVHDNTTIRAYTYRECLDRARRWTATYRALGVPAGGRVAHPPMRLSRGARSISLLYGSMPTRAGGSSTTTSMTV